MTSDASPDPPPLGARSGSRPGTWREVALPFFRLGLIAFGGPAAHIAMMEDEFVARRAWVTRRHFLDLVGATNLIPGPNSTEMTMHLGYERAGWKGLVTAGACFILPAVAITLGFAWLYVSYGDLPAVEPFLVGIKPAVIAIILGAVWRLGRTAVRDARLGVLGLTVAAAVLLGVGEVPALLAGGLAGMLWIRAARGPDSGSAAAFVPILFLEPLRQTGAGGSSASAGLATAAVGSVVGTLAPWKLFVFFLKIGAILYGSGYVLVAFLEGGLVQDLGWLTQAELLDAIAIGQLTPGPVLSTATFIGYVIEGLPGAAAATLGIFLPSFLFVWILNPLIPRMRDSVWLSAFLDAISVAAVALMAAVAIELGAVTLTSWQAWLIAGAATVLAFRIRANAAWLVLGGAVAGWLLRAPVA